MLGTRSGPSAAAMWRTPAILAETISFGPEILLIAAVFLLVSAAAMVAYLVGGYVAVHRVAAGSRAPRDLVLTVLAVLVGGYLVLVTATDPEWYPALVGPMIHGVAAWRGQRAAGEEPPPVEAPPPPR